jgi:hypothetical protein
LVPVHWTISHPARLVVAVTKGAVGAQDIERYFIGVSAAGGMSYRKIFEVTHTPRALSDETLKTLGARIVDYAANGQIGPVAIVAASDESFAKAQVFAAAAQVDRPLRIFRELHVARRWLDAQPVPESSDTPDAAAAPGRIAKG